MAQKIWEFEGDWYIQPESSFPICVNTKEAAQDYLESFSIPIEPPVILPERNSFGQWIFLCNELPPKESRVIASDGKKVAQVYYYGYTAEENIYNTPQFAEGVFEKDTIIKWMPLPKP